MVACIYWLDWIGTNQQCAHTCDKITVMLRCGPGATCTWVQLKAGRGICFGLFGMDFRSRRPIKQRSCLPNKTCSILLQYSIFLCSCVCFPCIHILIDTCHLPTLLPWLLHAYHAWWSCLMPIIQYIHMYIILRLYHHSTIYTYIHPCT